MTASTRLIAAMHATTVLPNSLAIWGLGQMGVVLQGPDAVIYIDPCLSDVVRERAGDLWGRAYDPPVAPHDVTNATHYLISHEHLDHLDPLTAGPVAQASPQALFVAPGWCRELLADLDIGDERALFPTTLEPFTLPGASARVTAIPAAHYDKEYHPDHGHRYIGYLIEWNGVTFYHAGDTILYPGYVDMLKQLPRIDVAILPVNGRDYYRETELGAIGNLLPVEAARLARDLGWDVLIPGHNDLYPNNAIPMEQIVAALAQAAPRQRYKFLQAGELYYYVKV